MRKISAKIVADSVDPRGNRITSYILTYPRFIHAEVMTHRTFSRNAASSRAIPFKKMMESVKTDPFVPIAFQGYHKGMQGDVYLEGEELARAKGAWLEAASDAVYNAEQVHEAGVTKQLANRLLEPYLWYTNLVTATEYDNFFELRCPKYPGGVETFKSKKEVKNFLMQEGFDSTADFSELDWIKNSKSHAEIHIQALAEAMWDARNESKPSELVAGEWHIPFGDRITGLPEEVQSANTTAWQKIMIATARCARLSYETHDGKIDYEKDFKLHDQLLERKHASCFEHCARVMDDDEYISYYRSFVDLSDTYALSDCKETPNSGWCRNFKGFIPYREIVKL